MITNCLKDQPSVTHKAVVTLYFKFVTKEKKCPLSTCKFWMYNVTYFILNETVKLKCTLLAVLRIKMIYKYHL
jgi:hypothetical protein